MRRDLLSRLLVACAAFAVASCGGGGSYGASSPMPMPTPTPTPTPAQAPAIFPNVSTNTDFAALGLQASGPAITVDKLVRDGFSVKFDAASNAYFIGVPPSAPTRFLVQQDNDNNYWFGSAAGADLAVLKPSSRQLTYTTLGIATSYYSSEIGFMAFGSATPAAGIPASGSATFDAVVAGVTLDPSAPNYPGSPFKGSPVGGSATLQFDFGAGTLAGHFDPVLNPNGAMPINLGTYSFVNTVYGAGKTNFSGQLSISGAGSLGAFDGQFTGPAAQELMTRWTAPYLNPTSKQWSQMFGVWVGKKR